MKLYVMLFMLFFSFYVNAEVVMNAVAEDSEVYPYVMGSGDKINQTRPGVAIDVLNLVAQKIGVKINIARYKWTRCLDVELKNGKADIAILASYKDERKALGAYPMKGDKADEDRRFTTITYSFFKKKGTPASYNGKEFQNVKSVSAPKGYSIVAAIKKLGVEVEETDGTFVDFKKLHSGGRVDLAAAHEETALIEIERHPEYKATLEKVTPPLATKHYYFMLSNQFVKNNPELAEKFWNAVKEVREKELNGLFQKYSN